MLKRRVAGKCGATNSDGLSLHKFPKDGKLRTLWTKFVQTTCRDFAGPSSFCVGCSLHFSPDSYEANPVADSLGFETR